MFYSQEMIDYLREISHMRHRKEIHEMFQKRFNVTVPISALSSTMKRYDIKTGFTGRFEKGHIPKNKGKKWSEYMSLEAQEKAKKTWFAKGTVPGNHREVGESRITKDGYLEVKVAEPNKWELLHRVIWIEHNGQIPENHIIDFGKRI